MLFHKMHGLGNDFVVLDHRGGELPALTDEQIQYICNRNLGVGCDQLIVLQSADNADAEMRIYNPDGSPAGMCGNAARCVVWLIAKGEQGRQVRLTVGMRTVTGTVVGSHQVTVSMGAPSFVSSDIPVSAADACTLPTLEGFTPAGSLSMGNPHVVFFVDDVDGLNLHSIGPKIERHNIFPEGVNAEFAQVISPNHLKMRVWERGTGATQACGSGACATAVLAIRSGHVTGPGVQVDMPGGTLHISWDGHEVQMTGPICHVYNGTLLGLDVWA